jgi:phospholipid/cholesterol/gamma-HCH transport system permease protein
VNPFGPGESLALFVASLVFTAWQARSVREFFEEVGFRLTLMFAVLARLPHLPRRRRWTVVQTYQAGIGNLHVVLLVGLFIGMIVSLQTGIELARFGQQDQIGFIVAATMAREMGPFITAVILAATTGSALAAELGTMKVSDELSALDVMSIDVTSFLVLPRVVALIVVAPMLAVICDMIGVIGGGLVASAQLDVGWTLYFDSALEALTSKGELMPLPKDVYCGLFKASVFGLIVATISCACGLKARGGALGVGKATSRAVRDSIIAVIIANYFLTWMIYQS